MPSTGDDDSAERIRELEERLADSEETLRALRSGEVDAIVAAGPDGDRIYTLKGADEAYRQIVEEMTEGALTLTPDGLILFSNERFAVLVGMPLEQVIGSHVRNFIAPEDAEVLMALRSRVLRDGKAEVRLHSPATPAVPVYLSWKRVKQEELECVSVIVTDLSEQKRNEEIIAAEKLARSILEQAAEAIVVTDLEGRIIRASRAADRLAGVQVFQREFDDVFQIRLSSRAKDYSFRDILADVKDHASVERVETTAITSENRTVQLLLSSAALANPDGLLLGCIITLVDITERKRLERDLWEANEQLLRSNQDLQRFAYVLSHDLQSPLRTVASMVQLFAKRYEGTIDPETTELLDLIQSGVHRMSRLITDLLEYSFVSEGVRHPTAPVESSDWAKWALANLQSQITETNACVTIEDPLPCVVADDQLARVFQNLIGNAIKYRSEEPPQIRISATRAGDQWTFAVRDNGIGFDMKYVDKIFGVFQRLHGTDRYEGTGIGLAICKKIIERYGGRMWADSAPGEGATFYFTIPACSDN